MAVANAAAEAALRACLTAEGFSLTPQRGYGEIGVDVVATKPGEVLHIEVIGLKASPPARSKDFFEVFFRAISRLNDGANRVVIALPARFGQGLHQRATFYGVAWQRLGLAFPELEVWLIDHSAPSYRRCTWLEWLTSTHTLQPGDNPASLAGIEPADTLVAGVRGEREAE